MGSLCGDENVLTLTIVTVNTLKAIKLYTLTSELHGM